MSLPKEVNDVSSYELQNDGREGSDMLGTSADQEDMYRMGKTQQTQRNFKGLTIFGFSMILLGTWEAQLGTAVFGLLNGGTAGLIWMYLVSMVGFGFVIASMAEIVSMAPTAGGQYHWVSEFAPRSIQKILSYAVGWLLVMGWQVGGASIAFVNGTVIQGLIILNNESYVPHAWHGTLLAFSITASAVLFNTFLAKHLPILDGIILVFHVLGFFAIAIPLWVMADRSNAKEVFTQFSDGAGWGSLGLSALIGILSGVNTFVGSDAAAHMSEEVRDASRVLPRAMMWTWLGNGLFGFLMAITLCFCLGDLDSVLATPTGYPYIQIFYNATGSKAGTTFMVSMVVSVMIFACAGNVATCSRQLFAFSRDKGFPFHEFFAQIHPRFMIPLNAVILTCIVSLLLSLLNLGSSIAFNQILSIGIGSMLTSYMISIGCVMLRRMRGQPLLPSKFDLGSWGLPINIIAVAFLLLSFVLAFFPPAPNPSAKDMNWGVVVYVGVLVISLIYYLIKGRFEYDGPVTYVRKSA